VELLLELLVVLVLPVLVVLLVELEDALVEDAAELVELLLVELAVVPLAPLLVELGRPPPLAALPLDVGPPPVPAWPPVDELTPPLVGAPQATNAPRVTETRPSHVACERSCRGFTEMPYHAPQEASRSLLAVRSPSPRDQVR
jgi:hypothetical protein